MVFVYVDMLLAKSESSTPQSSQIFETINARSRGTLISAEDVHSIRRGSNASTNRKTKVSRFQQRLMSIRSDKVESMNKAEESESSSNNGRNSVLARSSISSSSPGHRMSSIVPLGMAIKTDNRTTSIAPSNFRGMLHQSRLSAVAPLSSLPGKKDPAPMMTTLSSLPPSKDATNSKERRQSIFDQLSALPSNSPSTTSNRRRTSVIVTNRVDMMNSSLLPGGLMPNRRRSSLSFNIPPGQISPVERFRKNKIEKTIYEKMLNDEHQSDSDESEENDMESGRTSRSWELFQTKGNRWWKGCRKGGRACWKTNKSIMKGMKSFLLKIWNIWSLVKTMKKRISQMMSRMWKSCRSRLRTESSISENSYESEGDEFNASNDNNNNNLKRSSGFVPKALHRESDLTKNDPPWKLSQDFSDIFIFKNSTFYFRAVEMCILLNCLYLSMWVMNFIYIVFFNTVFIVAWELLM